MFNQVAERKMHVFRYILVVSWLLLILSLFIDPISPLLTDPNSSFFSPLKDNLINLAQDPETCIRVQGKCLISTPYAVGARLFWGFIVPSAIAIVFVLGHETWRRICPLYFLSQIPRGLGMKPRKKIAQNKWLVENHLYLQFALFFLGLNMRILFINSARPVFGFFLLFTIASAIAINFIYGGRSWCHYVCPFGMVQMVFTGPRALLGSEAQKEPAKTITQSMCRTFDPETNSEKIACIGCKSPCMDIDAEKAYWEQLTKPGRRLVQYGYLGLVCGYFLYYFLYSGNFNYYFSGAWTHEAGQVAKVLHSGFYFGGQAIPIPKLIASPLTLAIMVGIFYVASSKVEKIYGAYLKKQNPDIDRKIILHRVFTVVTFLSFNAFYVYGGRPEILRLPVYVQISFNVSVVLVSTFWLYRTWGRTANQYNQESISDKLRRQLQKLKIDFTSVLGGRSIDNLKANELELLAQVLPKVTRQDRLQVYHGVLEESLQAGNIEASNSLHALESIRKPLAVTEEEHFAILTELGIDDPNLLKSPQEYAQEERLKIESYQEALTGLLQELVDSGMPVHEAVEAKTKQISNLKNQYNITKQEHLRVLDGLFNSLRPKAEKLLALVQVENSRYQIISDFQPHSNAPIFHLLGKLLLAKKQLIVTPLLAVLELLKDEPDVVPLARRTGILAPHAIAQVFATEPQWQQRLNPQILRELIPSNLNNSQINVIQDEEAETLKDREPFLAQAVEDVLLELLQEPNPITESVSLYALTQLNQTQGLAKAQQILQKPFSDDLVKDTAASLLAPSSKGGVIEQLLSISRQPHFKAMTPEQLLSISQHPHFKTMPPEQLLSLLKQIQIND
ncbi:4Fe-4S binding protein [Pleurocapsa sp. PCC 7319]|uniref:4Fe-4S binding protein n=1 Tax=Pleurocapsa sp. PCC 7319 TaxID=118161 RepID=UPI0003618E16|nr:4Fe-4S binding protein [Pleurocapsa sp. PCC 7319]